MDFTRRRSGSIVFLRHDLSTWLGVVRNLATNMAERLPSQVPVEDLVAAGAHGLIRALNERAMERVSDDYVLSRIRGAILDELRMQDWLRQRAQTPPRNQELTADGALSTPRVDARSRP